eukprot:scaffold13255_cov128-Isochrysis_galbana.AAC.11
MLHYTWGGRQRTRAQSDHSGSTIADAQAIRCSAAQRQQPAPGHRKNQRSVQVPSERRGPCADKRPVLCGRPRAAASQHAKQSPGPRSACFTLSPDDLRPEAQRAPSGQWGGAGAPRRVRQNRFDSYLAALSTKHSTDSI